jgi:hypothetical protein
MGTRKGPDFWLAVGLFLLLLIVTGLAAVRQAQEELSPPLSSLSSAPDGARALRLWLGELGYAVDDKPLERFVPPPQATLIFMLEPFAGIKEEEWAALDDWVEAGGVLILAGNRLGSLAAMRHYDLGLSFLSAETLTAPTPLLALPPLPPEVAVSTTAVLRSNRNDFVVHLATGARPVLISFEQGKGRVFVSATIEPFSNAGLKQGDNAIVALNLISAAAGAQQAGNASGNSSGNASGNSSGNASGNAADNAAGNAVWFNEWHHGLRARHTVAGGPGNWLRRTPAGQALLYTAAVVFLALLLRGRRFGRPLLVAQESGRRAPLEYITAIANMKRRAGHRTAALAHYHHHLKRSLGQRYRLSPALPDAAFVSQLARYNPALDAAALLDLLSRLGRPGVGEGEMVELAAEASKWIRE